MVLPESLQSDISRLKQRLCEIWEQSDEELDYEAETARKTDFLKILSDTCALVREETTNHSPHLPELVEAANQILTGSVESAYGDSYSEDSGMFDFMPSWAHDDAAGQPLVNDTVETRPPYRLQASFIRGLCQILQVPRSHLKLQETTPDPDPWNDTMKRHPKSSPLARFRPNIPALTPTLANPAALNVYDARCEVQSEPISSPIELLLSQNDICLALNAVGGYKNRVPALRYYLLSGSEPTTQLPEAQSTEPGLVRLAINMALDESRQLIFVGDYDRVKSYAWANPSGECYKDEPRPTHTLNSARVDGPLVVLPNGTVVRAGKGEAAVWNIDSLETHGENGKGIIGKEDWAILEETLRDDPEKIELSTGSSPTSYIKFADHPDLSLNGWKSLVQVPSTMLCYLDNYDCLTVNLEQEGRMVSRYLGHGGKIADLSVSGGDPQMFLTACGDGYARLFDLRTPLPVVTLDACQRYEGCNAAVLAYPDGIATVFTGTGRAEQIKMWDVRARTPVYELATGNNRVHSLAWDSTRNHLYAATDCSHQDRMGYHHGYRPAKPKAGKISEATKGEEDEGDFADDGRAWPKDAWHDENYFGYMLDAGEDRIYRYAFKAEPDVSILPDYGNANAYERSMFWQLGKSSSEFCPVVFTLSLYYCRLELFQTTSINAPPPMVLPEALESRIARLGERLGNFVDNPVPEDSELDDRAYKSREKKFLKIFSDTCALVREQTSNQSPHLSELVEKAREILDDGVEYAYEDSHMFDFMPSWAHDDAAEQPLIKDNSEPRLPVPASALRELFQILQVPSSSLNLKEITPDPWKNTMKRHPKSSPLARFRLKIPALTPTAAGPLAMSVYDARCEVQSNHISSPIDLHLSQGNVCLALNAMGGWKNRSPALYYYLLDGSEAAVDLPDHHFAEPGLAHVAFHLALDEGRRLIFVGDERRIKSYAWATSDGENCEDEPFPTHTLASGQNSGPMTVLPNGTLVRAGKGQVAVWNINDLDTHGEDGDEVIGDDDEDMLENTWRDDPEEIETSSGSPATSQVKFADQPDLSVTRWRPLVHAPSTMLCHSDPYDCFTIDLEHEGRVTSRYLGHGGKIADLSVSGGDPQVFLTACSDGYARLFDLRTPLPVLTFDACGQSEYCDAVVLAHPDGIPTVFTGTGRAEQIKMWDVRARTPVYELATGNNRVVSLAWDSTRNYLYAATECIYQDRMGYRHDYRRAKMSTREDREDDDEDDDEDDEDDDEGDFDDFDERAWPKNAWHDENYFGYAFDAGGHRIYRYAFKENPDISVVPEYGDARVNESSSFW